MAGTQRLLSAACLASLAACLASCARPMPPAPQLSTPAHKPVAPPEPAAADQLRKLAERYWTVLLSETALPLVGEGGMGGPLAATALGDHRFDGKLDDPSPEAHARLVQALDGLRTEADALSASALSGEDAITLEILRSELLAAHEAEVCRGLLWLVDQQNGYQSVLPQTQLYIPLGTAKGAAELAARYGQADRFFERWIAALREGLAQGLTTPRTNLKKTLDQVKSLLAADAAHSVLLPPPEKFAGLPKDQRGPAREAVQRAVESSLLPGLRRFREFLETELLPKARTDVGIWALPGGDACYRFLVRYHTGSDLAPEQLHELGLSELAKIEAEQEAIAKGQGARPGPDGHIDLRAFTASLTRRKEQFRPDGSTLLDWNRETLSRAMAALPRAFSRMPPRPIETRAIPAWLAAAAVPAYYQPAPDDGAQPAIYYVNIDKPETRALYNEEALCFHETVPGHHLQISLAQELRGLPDFRRQSGQTAFIEGWALYAERMADDSLHLYSGPLARYGMLGYQAWRASRLVVDTGMHALKWDREKALSFLRDHTTLTAGEAANEIDRYVVNPGQALAYMVGELEIQKLRRTAEARLGPRFDLREFHDVILTHGAVPMAVAARTVAQWLDAKQPPAAPVPSAQEGGAGAQTAPERK